MSSSSRSSRRSHCVDAEDMPDTVTKRSKRSSTEVSYLYQNTETASADKLFKFTEEVFEDHYVLDSIGDLSAKDTELW